MSLRSLERLVGLGDFDFEFAFLEEEDFASELLGLFNKFRYKLKTFRFCIKTEN